MRFGDNNLANWTRQAARQTDGQKIPPIEAAHCLKMYTILDIDFDFDFKNSYTIGP